MIYLIIFYAVFLLIYLIFNLYAVWKISTLRIPGDKTNFVIFLYLVVVATVITISILAITGTSLFDWKK